MKQVFLSSVATGLEGHRDAAYAAIQGLDGYHCIRMEDFGARNAASADFCREKVFSCDIFVGLVGPRYGSSPTGIDTSFTELEYDAAVDKNMPRLLFVTSEDFPVPSNIREDENAHKRALLFKNRVLEHRVVDFFKSSEELAAKVVRALHNSQPGSARCQAYCLPALVRPEGYTERLGDIQVTVYGIQRPEQVDISLTLSANVTNRTNAANVTDSFVLSERKGILARGRLQGFNSVIFEAVRLDQSNPEVDEILTISGVRANCGFEGPGGYINGRLEIKAHSGEQVLFRGPIAMGLLPNEMTLFVEKTLIDVVTHLGAAPPGERVRSFIVEFRGSFPSAFKTRNEESGSPWHAADQGTVLVLHIPFVHPTEGFRLFTTICEISSDTGEDSGPIGKAVRVRTDAHGAGSVRLDVPARLIWDARVPMVEAEQGRAAWEVASPLPDRFVARDFARLRFGMAIVGPEQTGVGIHDLCGCLAPYYSSALAIQALPKASLPNLPVPRFKPGRVSSVRLWWD